MARRCSVHLGRAVAAFLVYQLALSNAGAAPDPTVGDISRLARESGIERGIAVYLGCGDGEQLLALSDGGRFVVQGLDRDGEKVAAARATIQSRGAYGPVSARLLRQDTLPYEDNLINLLIADDTLGISQDEMLRALRPLGVAWIRQDGSWEKIVKPWSDQIDEWTHFLHNASGNPVSSDDEVGPPRRLQWSAGPLWGRSHEFNSSLPAMVSARGRLFYIFDNGITGLEDERLPEKWTLMARDAFNGTLLWQRPLTTWGTHQWKTRALRFLGGAIARRLVADGDKLYCTFDYGGDVHILDAATGDTLATIPGTEGAEEILVADGQVICGSRAQLSKNEFTAKITCYDIRKEKVVWQTDDSWLRSLSLAAGDDAVVYQNDKRMVCLNRSDGSVRWKSEELKLKANSKGAAMIIVDGKVVTASAKEIVARSITDGKPVWRAPGVSPKSMREYDLFHIQGRLWCSDGDGSIVGYDVDTGERTAELDASSVQSGGHHLRCYRAKATENYLITQYRGVEFLSLGDEAHNQNDWLRGSCTYGVMPANGMLYTPPHVCFCFAAAMSKGFNAFTSAENQELKQWAENASPGELEKGPRYGSIGPQGSAPGDWPSYRHDSRRTGATASAISRSLRREWKAELGADLTPPVSAGGRVFVAAKDRHTIHALDSKTGEELWTFASGGRIDSPPSIYRGMLVFGSADGFLYCVGADDGRLAWRRRMAPEERWMAADGQLESVWRLHGSVAILDGLAYGCAGRSSYLDGGMFFFAVDIQTGEIKHRARVDTLSNTREDTEGNSFVSAYHIEGAHSDLLTVEGGFIYLNQLKFSPDLTLLNSKYLTKEELTKRPSMNLDNKDYVNDDIFNVKWRNKRYGNYDELAGILVDEATGVGERDMGLHLFTTSGFLDSTFFNRTYWMYSSTWPGFNISNLAPKAGQLLVIGPDNTYALKAYTSRFPLSPKYEPETTGYQLIADANGNEPTLDPRAWAKDKGMGFSRGAPPVWNQWLPVRAKALTLAGETLVVCGNPDVLKKGDVMAAFEGRMGSELRLLSAADGATLARYEMDESPIFDGMIVADGQLYISTEQGALICMAARPGGEIGP